MSEACPLCGAPLVDCEHCHGTGKVGPDGSSWKHWLDLPIKNGIAVIAGIVKPDPCPRCHGSGKRFAH